MRNDHYNEARDYHNQKIAELKAAHEKGFKYYEVIEGEFKFHESPPAGTAVTAIIEGLKKHWG